ncbi:MAG: Ig-like domain-containing protein [Clostridia bacterium]|nr:Ig-like domain-containing protein [Clostridia bacterium]
MNAKKVIAAILSAFMMLSVLSCTAFAATLKSLNVSELYLAENSLFQLDATNIDNSKVKWTTANSQVAAVSPNGAVVGVNSKVNDGKTTITATYGGDKVSIPVTIVPEFNQSDFNRRTGRNYCSQAEDPILFKTPSATSASENRGIWIGSTMNQVIHKYGEPRKENTNFNRKLQIQPERCRVDVSTGSLVMEYT